MHGYYKHSTQDQRRDDTLRILPCVGDRGKWYAFLSTRGSEGRNKERKGSVSERDSVSLQRGVLVHHTLHLSYSDNQVHELQLFITKIAIVSPEGKLLGQKPSG